MNIQKFNGKLYLIRNTRGHTIGRELDINTLPQFIQDRFSVLSVMEEGATIEGVGERKEGGCFEVNHILIGEKS